MLISSRCRRQRCENQIHMVRISILPPWSRCFHFQSLHLCGVAFWTAFDWRRWLQTNSHWPWHRPRVKLKLQATFSAGHKKNVADSRWNDLNLQASVTLPSFSIFTSLYAFQVSTISQCVQNVRLTKNDNSQFLFKTVRHEEMSNCRRLSSWLAANYLSISISFLVKRSNGFSSRRCCPETK